MTPTLKERIARSQYLVDLAAKKLATETADLRKIEAERVHCPHTFERAVPGYEHEGGYCSLCGINELYAHTLAKWAKTA